MSRLFEVRQSEGRGFGAFALKNISKGTVILREEPVLRINKKIHDITYDDAEAAFTRLSPRDQEKVLELHEDHKGLYDSKFHRILRANAFGQAGPSGEKTSTALFLQTSRFNHSCLPSASKIRNGVAAEKDIQANEEILISYADDIYELLTAKQRRVLLQRNYGFTCSCIACRSGEYQRLSDMRRQLVAFLRAALEGIVQPDYGKLEDIKPEDMWRVWPPAKRPRKTQISAAQKIEFTFLLARLREAEGMSAFRTAEAYSKAAEHLLDHLNVFGSAPELDDIVTLAGGRCVRDWMLKALAVFESVMPPDDPDLRIMRYNWSNISNFTIIKLATDPNLSHIFVSLLAFTICSSLTFASARRRFRRPDFDESQHAEHRTNP